jgi:hypothetical protein
MARGTVDVARLFVGLFLPSGQSVIEAVMESQHWGTDQVEFTFPAQTVVSLQNSTSARLLLFLSHSR